MDTGTLAKRSKLRADDAEKRQRLWLYLGIQGFGEICMLPFEHALSGIPQRVETQSDRDLIATILLHAVEESFRPEGNQARRWLQGWLAEGLFVLLDISPSAALEHLSAKWERIDATNKRGATALH